MAGMPPSNLILRHVDIFVTWKKYSIDQICGHLLRIGTKNYKIRQKKSAPKIPKICKKNEVPVRNILLKIALQKKSGYTFFILSFHKSFSFFQASANKIF